MKPKFFRLAWEQLKSAFPCITAEIDYFRRNRYFEPDLWLTERFCDRTSRSIDVGVNEGIYSRFMAKHSGRVEGFECNPFLIAKLNLFLPRNAHLHQIALSSSVGTTTLRFDPKNTGIGTVEPANSLTENPGIAKIETVDVETTNLDQMNWTDVTFMKVDVEGHELEVLKGARETLARCLPAMLIEVEERHCAGNLEAVPAWLTQFGYRSYVATMDGKALIEAGVKSAARDRGINNFWFLAKPTDRAKAN